ncbi:uncharacterized protein LOC100378858 [Saccoglossus kowalevskii]|uniref:Zinc finger protein 100-like isoform X1 n=1 Tax=Saccoglossus kowalevskii TaxID=10224 RepID=A0ABM0M2H2_SACKO|nr:PREDICTED: zinc finger protein 100-like isoform X1 [Saccoglossus kowalevskii]XP_006814213.1 PREDICTED: zinc finger protein 100-like isoform X2 [Saccoglossus kowalevskii]
MPRSFLVKKESDLPNEECDGTEEAAIMSDKEKMEKRDVEDREEEANNRNENRSGDDAEIQSEMKKQDIEKNRNVNESKNKDENCDASVEKKCTASSIDKMTSKGKQKVEQKSDEDDGNTQQRTKKTYECCECGKVFNAQYTLTRHQPVHTGVRKYACNVCGKTFRQGSTLCRHKVIHSDNRPFKCQICSKDFNRSSSLIAHMKTHCKSKPHVCYMCGKGFHQKGNLKNHMHTHTGERPYQCPCCERCFNQLSNLSYHLQQAHSDKKLLTCHVCKETFHRKYELRKHEMENHKINYPCREPPRYARDKKGKCKSKCVEVGNDEMNIDDCKDDIEQTALAHLNTMQNTNENNDRNDDILYIMNAMLETNNNEPNKEETGTGSDENTQNVTVVDPEIVNLQKTSLVMFKFEQLNHLQVVNSDITPAAEHNTQEDH